MSTISPCGKRIVFRSSRKGGFNLYIMDIDGANIRQLTDGPWRDNFPVFSPAGDEIAFSSNRDGIPDKSGYRTFDNYILGLEPDGSPGETRRITNHSGQTSHPYYSPDEPVAQTLQIKWICYTSERGGINDEEPVVQEVVFAPSDVRRYSGFQQPCEVVGRDKGQAESRFTRFPPDFRIPSPLRKV